MRCHVTPVAWRLRASRVPSRLVYPKMYRDLDSEDKRNVNDRLLKMGRQKRNNVLVTLDAVHCRTSRAFRQLVSPEDPIMIVECDRATRKRQQQNPYGAEVFPGTMASFIQNPAFV